MGVLAKDRVHALTFDQSTGPGPSPKKNKEWAQANKAQRRAEARFSVTQKVVGGVVVGSLLLAGIAGKVAEYAWGLKTDAEQTTGQRIAEKKLMLKLGEAGLAPITADIQADHTIQGTVNIQTGCIAPFIAESKGGEVWVLSLESQKDGKDYPYVLTMPENAQKIPDQICR